MASKVLHRPSSSGSRKAPLALKSWDEVSAFLAKHLQPVGKSPREFPVYDHQEEIELKHRLNVLYPDAA